MMLLTIVGAPIVSLLNPVVGPGGADRLEPDCRVCHLEYGTTHGSFCRNLLQESLEMFGLGNLEKCLAISS